MLFNELIYPKTLWYLTLNPNFLSIIIYALFIQNNE